MKSFEFEGISVDDGAGTIRIMDGEDRIVHLSEREARWLAITALPAMLPGIKTAAEKRDERLGNGG